MFKSWAYGVCGTIASAAILGGTIAPITSAQQPQPTPTPQAQPTTTPLPELQFSPRTRVQLNGSRVNITLINKTNAAIVYQAIGDTQQRTLAGRQTITLRGLRVPVSLTFDRQDAGLLRVLPKPSATLPNTLEVTLDTTTNLNLDKTTMRIEDDGFVFLY